MIRQWSCRLFLLFFCRMSGIVEKERRERERKKRKRKKREHFPTLWGLTETTKMLSDFSRYFHLDSHCGHPIFYMVFFFSSSSSSSFPNKWIFIILYFAPGRISDGLVSTSIIQCRVNFKSIRTWLVRWRFRKCARRSREGAERKPSFNGRW